MKQVPLPLPTEEETQLRALWTPRDIWIRLDSQLITEFAEDRRVEWKGVKRIHLDDLAAYLSAFSNTPDGGLLLYGVEDGGAISGCAGLSHTKINGIEKCHVTFCPAARPEIKRIPVVVRGQPDFVIAIYVPYIGRLVETNKGEAWIRYGDSKHLMSEEEKRDFRSTRRELSFEMDVAPYQYPDDFDRAILADFCSTFREREKRDWSDEEILVDRCLLIENAGQLRPTNALVLMAAKMPRRTIPGCRLRIQRFSGTSEGAGESYSPLQDRVIEGNVVHIIKESGDILDNFIYDVTWLNQEGKFVTTPEYPRWAWFEAIVNACVHRSYSFSGSDTTVKLFSDRMEIESPGGFVPPVNEQTIYVTRAARNHHLMDALRYLGYVRMAREGTRRIRESMAQYDLPDPLFKQESLHGVVVRVTLMNDHETRKRATSKDVAGYFGPEVWKELNEHERKIMAHTFRNKRIQVSEAQRVTGRTWATCKKDLERLTVRGLLTYDSGKYPRDPKAVYLLAEL